MTAEIFPKWCEADLAVYATPLYYHTMNAAMSNFIERTLPAAQPFFERDAHGNTTHPLRYKVPAAVWLSVCGFPEASEFDALSDYLNRTRHEGTSIVAEIYRPAAETLFNPFFKAVAGDVLQATREAGSELVESQQIAPATLARITQPFVDPEVFAETANVFWKTCIAEGVTPKTFGEKNMVPRPDSIATFMRIFPGRPESGSGRGTAADPAIRFFRRGGRDLPFHQLPPSVSKPMKVPPPRPTSPSKRPSRCGWIS